MRRADLVYLKLGSSEDTHLWPTTHLYQLDVFCSHMALVIPYENAKLSDVCRPSLMPHAGKLRDVESARTLTLQIAHSVVSSVGTEIITSAKVEQFQALAPSPLKVAEFCCCCLSSTCSRLHSSRKATLPSYQVPHSFVIAPWEPFSNTPWHSSPCFRVCLQEIQLSYQGLR